MKAKGGEWTFEELDKFLTSPRGYIPGTAMGYAGMQRADQRANVINFLHTLADKPVDLPKAAAK
jgi:cytochrome c